MANDNIEAKLEEFLAGNDRVSIVKKYGQQLEAYWKDYQAKRKAIHGHGKQPTD